MQSKLHNIKSEEEIKLEISKTLGEIHNEDKSKSLISHLNSLYETKLKMKNDDRFLDLIEDISIRLRTEGKYLEEETNFDSIQKYLNSLLLNIQGKKTLLEPLAKYENEPDPDSEEIPEKVVIPNVGFVPDYHSIFQDLEWAGISISDKEAYLLRSSLKSLVNERSLSTVSFWGKIYGIKNDYFIAESPGVEGAGIIYYNLFRASI